MRFVTVNMFASVFDRISWDCHANGARLPTTLVDYRDTVCPLFDRAAATLLDDLQERGLLETTLVVAAGEFGRAPYINANGGRDHWPKVFSIVMAGGGIARGTVYGSSDATATEPYDKPLTVEDWATTVYSCLGIVADKELMAPGGRPVEIVNGGQVLRELLA